MATPPITPIAALPGTVQPAPDGASGFDSDTVVTAEIAQQFADQNYNFCVRYLSLGQIESQNDLTAQEATNILSAGLALMAVQHVRKSGWPPSAALGQQYGVNAANHATSIGFPAGVNIWCDLEGVAEDTDPQDVIDYCSAWFKAVDDAGFVPGLYVGSDAILSGQQLYNLPFEHYWQSCSRVPVLPKRGYQMVQTLCPNPVNGIGIDNDVAQTDSEGGQALWLAPSPQDQDQ